MGSTTSTDGWGLVLDHRSRDSFPEVRDRFVENGISVEVVSAVLSDNGMSLLQVLNGARPEALEPYGGLIGVALLAAEVGARCSFLVARASSIRSAAVSTLLEDASVASVASQLGVSRQKVYEIARGASKASGRVWMP